MQSISLKIAYPIIIGGLFIMAVFMGLNYDTLTPSFYLVFLILSSYIFLFGFATGQNFAIPIKRLLQRADELSRGDVTTRFYEQGNDEIAQLGKAFNKIAQDFEQNRSQLSNLEKSVDIKVKARTQSLEETIGSLEQKVKNRTLELQHLLDQMEKIKQQPAQASAVKPQPEGEALPKLRVKRSAA